MRARQRSQHTDDLETADIGQKVAYRLVGALVGGMGVMRRLDAGEAVVVCVGAAIGLAGGLAIGAGAGGSGHFGQWNLRMLVEAWKDGPGESSHQKSAWSDDESAGPVIGPVKPGAARTPLWG